MRRLRSVLCVFLAFVMVSSICPNFAIAKSENNTITPHEPKSKMSEVKKAPEKGGVGWLWGILGIVLVAGAAAALAGGGGDSSGDDDDDGPVSTTGDYNFSW